MCDNPTRVGYHFTSYECWLKIKVEGLMPQPITGRHHDMLVNLYPEAGVTSVPERGCWVWVEKPIDAKDYLGIIMDRLVCKGTMHVVLLEVEYEESVRRDVNCELTHLGSMSHPDGAEFVYHREKKYDFCLGIGRCRLIGNWNFEELLKETTC